MTVQRVGTLTPIITPADVPGAHDANDATIAAYIAAVQAAIDGPTGWLGRALGEQALSMTVSGFKRYVRLPYEPVSDIGSVKYRDAEGESQTIAEASYRAADGKTLIFASDFTFPSVECAPDAVTIEYTAGYETADVPANAKLAVIVGVQQLKGMADLSTLVKSETVEGIGATSYAVPDTYAATVKSAMEALLTPLRLFHL